MTEPGMNYVIPTQPSGLIPIERRRTYKAKEGPVADKLRLDVTDFGTNEIRKLMVEIAAGETQQQMNLGNPPAFTNVDGTRGRSVSDVKRKLTISFGVRLSSEALANLKRGLAAAIGAATTTRTGTLSNMANWIYRKNGRPLPLIGASGVSMGPRDFITLMPDGVLNAKREAYATAANMRVAGTGKLSFRRSAKGKATRRNQSIGFLALAARAAGASPSFAGFSVTVGFTAKHSVRGEVTKTGGNRSGYIVIRPKTGKYR